MITDCDVYDTIIIDYKLYNSNGYNILTQTKKYKLNDYIVFTCFSDIGLFRKNLFKKNKDLLSEESKKVLEKYRNKEKIEETNKGCLVSGKHITECNFGYDYWSQNEIERKLKYDEYLRLKALETPILK